MDASRELRSIRTIVTQKKSAIPTRDDEVGNVHKGWLKLDKDELSGSDRPKFRWFVLDFKVWS